MSLNTNIQQTIKSIRDSLPPELSNLVEVGAGEISALSIVENAANVGSKVVDFSLPDKNGKTKRLSEYLKSGPVILTFYRGIWCPYCNLQLAAYNKHLNEFKKLGASLVALTPEGPDAKQALDNSDFPKEAKETAVFSTDFDVLHDKKNKIAEKFGLVFKMPKAHIDLLKMLKLDVEKANDDESLTFSDPATYIIGQDSIIKWAFVPNNYRKRAEPEMIIKALTNLK